MRRKNKSGHGVIAKIIFEIGRKLILMDNLFSLLTEGGARFSASASKLAQDSGKQTFLATLGSHASLRSAKGCFLVEFSNLSSNGQLLK